MQYCIVRKLQMINIRKATGYDNNPIKIFAFSLRRTKTSHCQFGKQLYGNEHLLRPHEVCWAESLFETKRTTSIRWIFGTSVFWRVSWVFMDLLSTSSFRIFSRLLNWCISQDVLKKSHILCESFLRPNDTLWYRSIIDKFRLSRLSLWRHEMRLFTPHEVFITWDCEVFSRQESARQLSLGQ